MGRGRAKAKQTKVARALKYGGPQTDLERLQAELSTDTSGHASDEDELEEDDELLEDDPYAKYYDDGDLEDADEDDSGR